MGDLKAVGIKACPREISRTPNSFYEDLGFTIAWSDSNPCLSALRRLQFPAPEFLPSGACGQLHDAPARCRRGGLVATRG